MYVFPKDKQQPIRIILVDDEEVLSWCITLELMALGYDVLSVDSVEAGREALSRFKPDLVICDQGLPDGIGTEMLIGSSVVEFHVPVIMITAFTPPRNAELEAVGADVCLRKPFDLHELTEAVAESLRKHPRRMPAAVNAAP